MKKSDQEKLDAFVRKVMKHRPEPKKSEDSKEESKEKGKK